MSTPDANRAAMALRLADKLREVHPAGEDPEVVAQLSDQGWADLAHAAGCRPGYSPSEATRATVVALIRHRHAYVDTDPFEGLA